jgi:hypothetical protein
MRTDVTFIYVSMTGYKTDGKVSAVGSVNNQLKSWYNVHLEKLVII